MNEMLNKSLHHVYLTGKTKIDGELEETPRHVSPWVTPNLEKRKNLIKNSSKNEHDFVFPAGSKE